MNLLMQYSLLGNQSQMYKSKTDRSIRNCIYYQIEKNRNLQTT
jgi:hypothetical protein